MKLMRRLCVLSLAAVFCVCCCACTAQEIDFVGSAWNGGSGDSGLLKQTYIGMVLKCLDQQYFPLLKQGAEDAADANDAQMICVGADSETDIAGQRALVRTMAKMAIDVLVIAPCQTNALESALALADENGIAIIAVDTPLDSALCACYIGTDDYAAGRQEGTYAGTLAGSSGTAIILRGQEGDAAHDARTDGLTDALEEVGVSILDTVICDSSSDIAQSAMAQALYEYEDISVLCTTSDPMALGAYKAIVAAEREDIQIVSLDGTPDGIEAVQDGKFAGVIAQDPYEMGQQCVRAAIALANGGTVEREIFIDTQLVTPDNADRYADARQLPKG